MESPMQIATCLRCGKIFQQIKLAVCAECEKKEDKEILEVHRYLRDHPDSSIDEVSDALEIYADDIERWLEEGRLTAKFIDRPALNCLFCGRVIHSGKVCRDCQSKFTDTSELESKSQEADAPRVISGRRGGEGEEDQSAIRKFRK